MKIIKNPIENKTGRIECQLLIGNNWLDHIMPADSEYELHDSSDWSDIKPCRQSEKDDNKAEQKRISTNNKSLAYLKETDWYVIRQLDLGTAIPEDIKIKRQQARESIS